ncbi:MAG TPA: hypothetical protein VE650_21645 [Acetobacteraceae bacterium]|nr:hypothetical protein [Acetobacteraceae bacterium]
MCLVIDSAALLVILLYSLKNEQQKPGSPERGYFRMRDPASKPAPAPVRRTRVL